MSDRLEKLLALEASAPDADLAYMIALEHSKADDHEQAIEWFDRALERDASYHYAYFQKAKSLSQLGEDDDAIEVIDAGITKAQADMNGKAVGELQELRAALQEL